MTEFQFIDAPPGRSHDKYRDQREACRANPGQWLLIIPNGWSSQVGHLRQSPRWNGFEFTCRRTDAPATAAGSRRYDVYGRFVGDDAS